MSTYILLASLFVDHFSTVAQELQTLPWDNILLGMAIGMIILPILLYLHTGQHRWFAVLALNIGYIFSFLLGGWTAAISAVVASFLTIILSAVLLRHLFDDTTWFALENEIRFAFGRTSGFQIVEDGKVTMPKGKGPVLGPRLVIIKPYNVAIFERGPTQSRIVGPSVFRSAPFEYVKRIFDLRDKQEWLTFEEVLSSDLLTVNITLYVNYGINLHDQARLGQRALLPNEIALIQRLDMMCPEWAHAVRSAIEASVRQAMGSMRLSDLLARGTLGRLETRIEHLVQVRTANWGIIVRSVVVEALRPTPGVSAGMTERTRVAMLHDTLRVTAEAYNAASAAGMFPHEIYREVLRHTLEKIAEDPAAKFYFVDGLGDLLDSLRQ